MQQADEDLVDNDNANALEGRILDGMEINAVDNTGATLLHLAAESGSVKCLKLLVQRGADVTLEDRGKNTPLHLAAVWDHAECVKVCPKGENECLFCIDVCC